MAEHDSTDKKPDTDTGADVEDMDLAQEGRSAESDQPSDDFETEPTEDQPDTEQVADLAAEDLPTDVPAETVVQRKGGFFPALLGGVLAAVLGFVAGKSQILDPILPAGWQSADNTGVLEALKSSLSGQQTALTDLAAQVGSIEIPDQAELVQRLDGIDDRLIPMTRRLDDVLPMVGALSSSIAELETRVTDVEKRPISEGLSEAAIAAYESELAKLQEAISAQRTDVEAMFAEARALEAKAASEARSAANQTGVARLMGRLDRGESYADILADLTAGGVQIPELLTASANDGIVTLDALKAGFPDAARAALAAAREETKGTGLIAFLERQTGARSVAPREGTDADSVLSRAEAALADGALDQVMSELETLPEPAQAALSDWLGVARTRLGTLSAAAELAQSLKSN